jgi:hypothetical protein
VIRPLAKPPEPAGASANAATSQTMERDGRIICPP